MPRGILEGNEIGQELQRLISRGTNQPYQEKNGEYEGVKMVPALTKVMNDGYKIKVAVDVYGDVRFFFWYAEDEKKEPGENATITRLRVGF